MLLSFILVYVRRVPSTSSSVVRRLFPRESRGCVRNYVLVPGRGDHGPAGVNIDVACTTTARAVGAITLVANRAFADNFTVGVGGVVGFDVGGACTRVVSTVVCTMSV